MMTAEAPHPVGTISPVIRRPTLSEKKDPEAEQRETSRYPVLRQGRIRVGNQTIYCAIHDLSLTGAKLQVGVKLPKNFELIIDGLQAAVLVDLKWQNVEYAGVAFQEALSTR
jgi:PilZ domain